LHFNEYLRSCREHINLTQEQLVHNLYDHDNQNFTGLDTNTLSKWERNTVTPKLVRQVSILKFFQKQTGYALPCLQKYSVEETEKLICRIGMYSLLGKSKSLMMNYPSFDGPHGLSIHHLRNSKNMESIIKVNLGFDKTFNHNTTGLSYEQIKEWAFFPGNSLFYCEYRGQFFGLLFTVRLKPEVFDKLMNHEIAERDLTYTDFASFEEMGSNYIFSFFSMNEKAATLLFVRYYAHIIANQEVIQEVGVATMMQEAKKLIGNMNFKYYASDIREEGLVLQTYRSDLANFLASERVLKMLLSKEECPPD